MRLREFTPLGNADKLMREELDEFDESKKQEYEASFSKYQKIRMVHNLIRVLLYAGIITSFTATFGLDTAIIARISSYVGVTFLLLSYLVVTYFSMRYRETFYLRRELLINSHS